jgi:hypothetical protein
LSSVFAAAAVFWIRTEIFSVGSNDQCLFFGAALFHGRAHSVHAFGALILAQGVFVAHRTMSVLFLIHWIKCWSFCFLLYIIGGFLVKHIRCSVKYACGFALRFASILFVVGFAHDFNCIF